MKKLSIIGTAALAAAVLWVTPVQAAENKIEPGIYVNDMDMSGKTVEEAQNYDLSAVLEVDGQPVPEGKISYTYKKGGWFGCKSDTLPTQPGEYVQTATVGGNYSCEKITRTIIIQ